MPINSSPPPHRRVAVIHDWLLGFRGGEHVLDAVLEIYPEAEIFTLFYKKGTQNSRIESRPIHASFLNRLPGAQKYYRFLLPLMPLAIEKFNLKDFDLVISTSHCVAKGVIPSPEALHVSYCFAPMRYAWDKYPEYFGDKLLEPLFHLFMHYLRIWDQSSSQRVDHFIALSQLTKNRIKKYYRRGDADVIYPFAHLERYRPVVGDKGDYYLVVSAFAPYKRIDLAIQACERMGKKLLIVGGGQEESKLRKLAGPYTQFLGKVANDELPDLYAGARALLFPGEEDFGIVVIEAMASGTPVIAFGKGGAAETIESGKTGLFFNTPTVEALISAIHHFEKGEHSISREYCVQQAQKFGRPRFLQELSARIEGYWRGHVSSSSRSEISETLSSLSP